MEKGTKDAYGKILGHLEHDLLEILWANGEATGKEIYARIKITRDIALTTVLTVLERLARKGIIKKIKGDSVYLFKPAYSKEDFARRVSDEVLKSIFEISTTGATASFVDMLADIHPIELDRLSRLIEDKRKELKKRTR